MPNSRYQFLTDTYRTEIEKVASVWAMCEDTDLLARPRSDDPRGRNLLEHMVHQSISEDLWFRNMLGITVTDSPLPEVEQRLESITTYVTNARRRLAALVERDDDWREEEVGFFETRRTRAWVMTRRIAHTAHHRGQQMSLLRMLGRDLHSNYGPTADTGADPTTGARDLPLT